MNSHTLCEYVLGAVFIDRDGEVYSCCHKAPASYGNIKTDSLAQILARPGAKAARARTRQGSLKCFGACNLLNYGRKHAPDLVADQMETFPYIKKLTLSLGWYCNVDCVMCPQDHHERAFLDFEAVKRHVPWTNVGEIIFEGGEPLAAPNVHPIWDHVAAQGKRANFCTNGLVMTESLANKIAHHSDYLYISFNAATSATYERVVRKGSWERLLRNVALVQRARERAGTDLRLIGHFTIVEENLHEVPEFIVLMDKLGFDIINFGYNRLQMMGCPIDTLLAENNALRERLGCRIRAAIGRISSKLRVDVSRLCYLGLLGASEPVSLAIVEPSGM